MMIPKKNIKPKFVQERNALPANNPLGRLYYRPGSKITGPNFTGFDLNEETALCLAAAWSCVKVISTDVASMPCQLVQKMDDGSYRQATEHAAYDLFSYSPDQGNTTPIRSLQAVMVHLLTKGSAYYGIDSYNDGSLSLRLIDPRYVQVLYTFDKRVVYQIYGIDTLVDRERIVHFAGFGWDGLTGFEPVSQVKQALALAQVSENYASSFTSNGNTSSGVLQSSVKYEDETAQQLVDRFVEMTSGGNLGSIGYLPPGVTFKEISVSPVDAQCIQGREFQIREIARIFGCPLNRLCELQNYSYSGMEAESYIYTQTTLRPWASILEQSLNLRLLTRSELRQGFTFRFDMDEMNRADTAARTALYTGLFNIGAITQNEIRTREGLPKSKDSSADKLWTPLNMSPSGGNSNGN